MLWFYDLNSLSLIFSEYRSRVNLIEVQHGSIINYPPYVKAAPVKIADLFYVKNQSTIDYLKTHLCANFPAEYKLIPYPQNSRKFVPGLHLFYASTVEFNGLHPVSLDFLKRNISAIFMSLSGCIQGKEIKKASSQTSFLTSISITNSIIQKTGLQASA